MMMNATLLPGITDPGHKAFQAETHRVVSPAATLERVRPFLRTMGITRIANVTGLDTVGIPTVVCCRPNSRSLAVSQGKGLTLAAAKTSAVMESIEAYHAEQITLPMKVGSAKELGRQHLVADIMALPRVAGAPLDENVSFLWMEGYDVISQQSVWVPHELVHINSTPHGRINAGFFCCTTNGLSAGNHLLESMSYGICEVVERDSMTLWGVRSSEAREETRLDLSTVDDARCREVLDKLQKADVAIAAWETTSDVGIPTFTCLIAERNGDALRSLHSAAGQGCHPTRAIALLRALTEAVQTRLTIIAGSRDDILRFEYDRHRNPDQLRQTRSLLSGENQGRRSFLDAPNFSGATFEDDIRWEIERLASVGIERVIVVDLSKDEFMIPITRVVIPGLEGLSSFPSYRMGARANAVRSS